MNQDNTLGKQLGIFSKELKLIKLHLYDIEHNDYKIDYIEYVYNGWVYKKHVDNTCIYYEDSSKLIRNHGR
jgi:hypothetical protein